MLAGLRARYALLALPAVLAPLLLVALIAPTHRQAARADSGFSVPVAQSVVGLPVVGSTLIGSSPAEAPGETWGYAQTRAGFQIVRYIKSSGWQIQASPLTSSGEQLGSFVPGAGPLAGGATPNGGVAILGTDSAQVDQLLVRSPGHSFQEAPTPVVEPASGQPAKPNAVLKEGETLLQANGQEQLVAPVDQPADSTGVFVVPHESGNSSPVVLFYDGSNSGSSWHREPICANEASGAVCEPPLPGFKALAIDASSPQNAWLLAQSGNPTDGVVLLARETAGGQTRWTRQPLGGRLGAWFAQANHSFENPGNHTNVAVRVTAYPVGQRLTVTGNGVWVDGQLKLSSPSETVVSFTLYYNIAEKQLSQSWCSPPATLAQLPSWQSERPCGEPLEMNLPPGSYRSFAWSEGGQYGERVITGLPDGVTLSLRGSAFTRVLGIGGESGAGNGAAFSSPQEGWLAPARGIQLTHLTTEREPDLLQPWPVPFERPLTAIATQPGATPGELGAQAIAVGQEGEVVHYYPGQGWVSESLFSTPGTVALPPPELRGVAWPEPGRAYAVGTHGAMWLWQQSTGLWEPDPTRPPNLFFDNFTGIAFNPANSDEGYAVGQQGVLLAYGKTWEREKLPPGLEGPEGANFTSIAFAGGEAIATYQVPNFKNGAREYVGGVLSYGDDPSCKAQLQVPAQVEAVPPCWHVDAAAEAALSPLSVPVRVAGLPDGGAAIAAAEGEVIERQGPGSPWQPAPAGSVSGFPVALASFREGGELRAVVSVDTTSAVGLGTDLGGDEALRAQPPEGQAPVVTAPYTLPASGYLLREEPSGWHDEEHEDYPSPSHGGPLPPPQKGVDWPAMPDAVLALALPLDGGEGWTVGGQTGEVNNGVNDGQFVKSIQTAGVMRYPASGAAPIGFSASPEHTTPGTTTFAIGGGAQCASACADLAEDKLGPDQWLTNALAQAAATPGVRAFLYTGPHLAPGLAQPGAGLDGFGFQREQGRYAEVLSSAGALPVYAAPSESDVGPEGGLTAFDSALGQHAPAGTAPPGTPTPPAGSGAYAFESSGVRVIVLDYSRPTLGEEQQCWLANQLASAHEAREQSIVIGNRAVTAGENEAADAGPVAQTLVTGAAPAPQGATRSCGASGEGASAYFFDSPEQDRVFTVSSGGKSIYAYGAGALGYVQPPPENVTEFLGASGFLLTEIEASKREETPYHGVHVKLIPDISQLAINPTEGTLLRRSHPVLFKALARRPLAGMECAEEAVTCSFKPNPYIPIPDPCSGPNCATGLFPAYTFSSSKPDVGDFVEPDPASPEGLNVLQGANGKAIPDAHSGLFCAYNPGTTTVTIHAGGLSASVPVTVLAGSVEQPCGTVPLLNPPAPVREASLPVPLPAPTPTPTPAPNPTLPPPPLPSPLPSPSTPPRPAQPHPIPAPVPQPAAQLFPLVPLVPLPSPNVPRPTPPSGTAQVPSQSPVSQQVSVTEREEEEQSAIQHVHNMAAYAPRREAPLPAWPLALVLLAAGAGVGMRRPREPARAEQRGAEPPRRR